MSIAGTEITQSSLFHSVQTEKDWREKNDGISRQPPLLREYLPHAIYQEGLCRPDEESNCAASLTLPLNRYASWQGPRDKIPRGPQDAHLENVAGLPLLIGYKTVIEK